MLKLDRPAEAGEMGWREAVRLNRERAREAYEDVAGLIVGWRSEGRSLREIAARLNEEGHTTRRGKAWNPVQVGRVLKRLGT